MEINGQTVNEEMKYTDLHLSDEVMRAIDKKGYVQATPVQAGAIPYFMEWKDVIAKAPTGTGKTFAFGIPMVEHTDPEGSEVTGSGAGPHPGAGHPDPGRAAGPVRLQGGCAGGLPIRRPAHR